MFIDMGLHAGEHILSSNLLLKMLTFARKWQMPLSGPVLGIFTLYMSLLRRSHPLSFRDNHKQYQNPVVVHSLALVVV